MKPRALLLCIAIGAVIGGAMILSHRGPGIAAHQAPSSPGSRNQLRVALLSQLQSALVQYKKEHGNLPVKLTSAGTEICTTIGTDCKSVHLADLSFLVTQGNYIPTMPQDPLGSKGRWASGFFIRQIGENITITAPEAEVGKTISVNFAI